MLRKQIIPPTPSPTPGAIEPGALDVAAIATVLLTSESPEHPIEHAFDGQSGPGGTRWVAGEPSEQTIILVFDVPQTIREVDLEVEELDVARVQELHLSLSLDGGRSYREVVRQEFNFSPPGTTFEREKWTLATNEVTHLRLTIKPDKGGHPGHATLTSLILR